MTVTVPFTAAQEPERAQEAAPVGASVLNEDFSDVPLSDQIACIKREIAMRERVYPGWIERGRMKPVQAALEIRRMRAVLKRLLVAERAEGLL